MSAPSISSLLIEFPLKMGGIRGRWFLLTDRSNSSIQLSAYKIFLPIAPSTPVLSLHPFFPINSVLTALHAFPMDQDALPNPDQDKAPEQQPVRQASDSAQELRRDTQDGSSGLGAFWAELKRRKVMRVAVTYIIASIAIIEFASATFGYFDIPKWAFQLMTLCLVFGLRFAGFRLQFPAGHGVGSRSLMPCWSFELWVTYTNV